MLILKKNSAIFASRFCYGFIFLFKFLNPFTVYFCGWYVMDLHYFFNVSVVHMYYVFLTHSSVNEHLGCFHVLAIVNSGAINIGVHVYFLRVIFSRYMPRSWIAGSHGRSVFSV